MVLILIILEYIYIHQSARSTNAGRRVLILIILEYIYMQFFHSFSALTMRLNPYYTGIHLHAEKENTFVDEATSS